MSTENIALFMILICLDFSFVFMLVIACHIVLSRPKDMRTHDDTKFGNIRLSFAEIENQQSVSSPVLLRRKTQKTCHCLKIEIKVSLEKLYIIQLKSNLSIK